MQMQKLNVKLDVIPFEKLIRDKEYIFDDGFHIYSGIFVSYNANKKIAYYNITDTVTCLDKLIVKDDTYTIQTHWFNFYYTFLKTTTIIACMLSVNDNWFAYPMTLYTFFLSYECCSRYNELYIIPFSGILGMRFIAVINKNFPLDLTIASTAMYLGLIYIACYYTLYEAIPSEKVFETVNEDSNSDSNSNSNSDSDTDSDILPHSDSEDESEQ